MAFITTIRFVSEALTPTVITANPIVTGSPLVITVPPALPLLTLAAPINKRSKCHPRSMRCTRSTLQSFVGWSTAALDAIGAPTRDNIIVLQSNREAAHMALDQFHQALEIQRQEER